MSKAHEIVRTGMRLAEFFRRFPDTGRLRCGSCLALAERSGLSALWGWPGVGGGVAASDATGAASDASISR